MPRGVKATAEKAVKQAYDIGEFKNLTVREHVLKLPNFYVGDNSLATKYTYVYLNNSLKTMDVTYSEAFERICLEILCNAGDNAIKSRISKVDPKEIRVTIDHSMITIWSSGKTIPIKKLTQNGETLWSPHWVFGVPMSGGNFDNNKNRTWGGTHGLGGKLTNIFSLFFRVRIGDPDNQKHYEQIWQDNMAITHEPTITEYLEDEPFVEVSFIPDMKRLGYKVPEVSTNNLSQVIKENNLKISTTELARRLGLEISEVNGSSSNNMNAIKYLVNRLCVANLSVEEDHSLEFQFPTDNINLLMKHIVDVSFLNSIKIRFNNNGEKNVFDFTRPVDVGKRKRTDQLQVILDSNLELLKQAQQNKEEKEKEKKEEEGEKDEEKEEGEEEKKEGGEREEKKEKKDAAETFVKLYFPQAKNIISYTIYRDVVKDLPMMEIFLIDVDSNEHSFISFVNGITVPDGGIHIDAVYDAAKSIIVPYVNDQHKDVEGVKISLRQLKDHMNMLVCCRVPNPEFESNSKRMMKKSTIGEEKQIVSMDFKFPEMLIKKIGHWTLLDKLNEYFDERLKRELKKTDGSKVKNIGAKKGIDANRAGTDESKLCTLFVVEGDSAAGFINMIIGQTSTGYDHTGYLPLKGKMLNVRKAKLDRLATNKEIILIKKYLGLLEGVDYSEERFFNTLRYGHCVVAADADNDGYHILLLFVSYLEKFYPSLLKRGFLSYFRTPLYIVSHKGLNYRFYTEKELSDFKQNNPGWESNHNNTRYNKGLGGMGGNKISEEYANRRIIRCVDDVHSSERINLAFGEGNANLRKEWILGNWRCMVQESYGSSEVSAVSTVVAKPKKRRTKKGESGENGNERRENEPIVIGNFHQDITNLIDTRLLEFSKMNLTRAIPDMISGMKKSLKQALWGMMVHYGINGKGDACKKVSECRFFKTNAAATKIMTETHYLHGESSMVGVLIKMTQDFTGSNNMRYFEGDGVFGTRIGGGKDSASPRYTQVKLEKWIPYVYRAADFPLLTFEAEEEVYPHFFFPIIPMLLVNGAAGMATGWSTNFPMFRPKKIIEWLLAEINGLNDNDKVKLLPWFRGFKGFVTEKILRNGQEVELSEDESDKRINGGEKKKEENEEDIMEDGEKFIDDDEITKNAKKGNHWVIRGKFELIDEKKGIVKVTEVPPNRALDGYKQWLIDQVKEGVFKDYDFNCRSGEYKSDGVELNDLIDITIKGVPKSMQNYDSLRLKQYMGSDNMVALDINGFPKRYRTVDEYMKEFYQVRLGYYEKRKLVQTKALTEKLEKMKMKHRFIEMIIRGEIKIIDNNKSRKKADILADFEKKKYPIKQAEELLGKVTLMRLTEEDLKRVEDEIECEKKKLQYYEERSAKDLWRDDLDDLMKNCKAYM